MSTVTEKQQSILDLKKAEQARLKAEQEELRKANEEAVKAKRQAELQKRKDDAAKGRQIVAQTKEQKAAAEAERKAKLKSSRDEFRTSMASARQAKLDADRAARKDAHIKGKQMITADLSAKTEKIYELNANLKQDREVFRESVLNKTAPPAPVSPGRILTSPRSNR